MERFSGRTFLGGIFVGILASEALYYAAKFIRTAMTYLNTNSNSRTILKKEDIFHKTVFFPDRKPSCKAQYMTRNGCPDKRCKYAHEGTAFLELMTYLTDSRHSVDLCVYCITSPELGDVIIELHNRGIRICIITDSDQADSTGSQIGKFRASGIQVRQGDRHFYMHHKFAVVDKKVLINGSFNWTRSAVLGNSENLHITNDAAVTMAYLDEFEKLWNKYDPMKINLASQS